MTGIITARTFHEIADGQTPNAEPYTVTNKLVWDAFDTNDVALMDMAIQCVRMETALKVFVDVKDTHAANDMKTRLDTKLAGLRALIRQENGNRRES